jgi:uncharacterized protein YjlB
MIQTMTSPAAVERQTLEPNGAIPNSPYPVLIYRNVLSPNGRDLARAFEQMFGANDWPPAWRAGLYSMHHYHSTAHEVLGIFSGWVEARLGGEGGPRLTLRHGDAILIPAGVAHRNEGESSDFSAVGAYPRGMRPDLCYGKESERARALRNLTKLPAPNPDPVFGTVASGS